MTTHLRRSTLSVLGALVLSTELESTAQSSDTAPASPAPTIEIDRSALVIDIATERRALDASIRRELARGVAAEREAKVAASGGRPRG